MHFKILTLILSVTLTISPSFAIGGYKYSDGGIFYTGVSFPVDAAKIKDEKIENIVNTVDIKDTNNLMHANYKSNFLNKENFDFAPNKTKEEYLKKPQKLKTGISYTDNILGFVETGDGSIQRAAKNGNIKKIHYIDKKTIKEYVPFFIPIRVTRHLTIVHGE